MTERSRKLLLALLALAAILPFLPALTAPFLEWDDAVLLARNPHWRGFSPANLRWMLTTMLGGPYQPLSWLSYALDFTLWGANPAAMRLTNFLLHAASAVLFCRIVEFLLEKASPDASPRDRTACAAFAALFWAVHPLRVESVVWLTERRDVLSGFFYLLTIRLYLRDPDRPLPPLLAFCAAVLAKASVVSLPLTLLLLDRWPLGRRAWAEKIPYFTVSFAAGLAGLAGQEAAGQLKGLQAAAGLHSLWWYAAKTAWPSGLSPYHRWPDGFGLTTPAVWLGALAALSAWALRRRAAGLAFLHYAVALLPAAGFVRFGHTLSAERYSYLPALSLSALAGAALLGLRPRRPAAAAAAAVLLALGLMSARGARWWSGDEALWRRAVEADPGSTYARVNLASRLRREGRVEEALTEERRAVAADPRLIAPLKALGAKALERKDFGEAERLRRRAEELEAKK